MIKKLLYKTALLLLTLIILNFIYSNRFYEEDIQKHSAIINLVRNIPENADIIYVGESSNNTYRNDDYEKRPISSFTADYFPDLTIYDITKPASHAGIFKVLLRNIPKENKARTIVVTMNLRSFNAQWIYSILETPLQKSMVLIKPYPPLVNRLLLSFKAYDIKSDDERRAQFKKKWKDDKFHLPYNFQFNNVIEWDYWMAKSGIRNKEGNIDYKQTELACHYIKAYGFQIDTLNNPRIQDFNDIIKLARKRNWNLVFNLLPENTEKAKELIGDDLIYLMNKNTAILVNYYQKRGITVVNNLSTVGNEQFIDQHWTTEHYAEKGRKIIAANLAKSLKKWHSDYYEEADSRHNTQTTFCNDGDVWEQLQTLTYEKAYSGKRSSLSGAGNDFSLTMKYALKKLPDSIKNNIKVEFMMYQTSLNHNAKLVLQASGAEFSHYWMSYDLNQEERIENQWIKYRKRVIIPDSIKQADYIKIYVFNPSKEKIFIDDFKIEFEK